MASRLTKEQLEKLRTLGFVGEGYLGELIEWLPKFIGSRDLEPEDVYCFELTWIPTEEWQASYSQAGGDAFLINRNRVATDWGKTPLEAVYNLAIAVKGE